MATYISIETDKKISYQIDGGDKQTMFANIEDDGYPEPAGTITITQNGTGIDVKDYALADVNVAPTNIITGTFTGNGTNTVTIECSERPDIILIDSVHSLETSGVSSDLLWYDHMVCSIYADASAATPQYMQYYKSYVSGLSEFNAASPGTRYAFATFEDGVLTVSHNTGTNRFGFYKDSVSYSYTLIYL